jgi:CHAT domain-containing protein
MPEETYIWVIGSEKITFYRSPIPRVHLAEMRSRFLETMEDANADPSNSAADLYAVLIAPVKVAIQRSDRIVIVADSIEAELPFAALRDSPGGQYLVERYTLSMSASATAFVLRHGIARHTSAVVIANPQTDLPPLSVRDEVEAVKRSMPRVHLFQREGATLVALRNAASSADVLHFATHAFSADTSREPVLALTPGTGNDDGFLTASEIEDLPVRPGALVVVAACRSARGRASSDGTLSLSRAFLSAGAGHVVGTLWNVTDETSARLLEDFYEALATGDRPADALRRAQLSILKAAPAAHPQRWAPNQVYGGN